MAKSAVNPTGYCMKCKTQREIKNPKQVTMKNGRPVDRGRVRDLQHQDVQNRRSCVGSARTVVWR